VLAGLPLALGLIWASYRPAPDEQAAVEENPAGGPDLAREARRAERLARLRRIIMWTIGQRSALVSDLLAGRSTLIETAAGFRAVNAVKEKHTGRISLPFPGRSEDEQLCRQVIVYVGEWLRDEPDRDAAVAGLEKELREHLRRYGTVRLPAPPRLDPPPF
jgi:hypothetical protein